MFQRDIFEEEKNLNYCLSLAMYRGPLLTCDKLVNYRRPLGNINICIFPFLSFDDFYRKEICRKNVNFSLPCA